MTDTWKKHGNDWYYLDYDGNVAVSQRVDEYYVDDDALYEKIIETFYEEAQ